MENTATTSTAADIKLAQLHAVQCAVAHVFTEAARDNDIVIIDDRLREFVERHDRAYAEYQAAVRAIEVAS